MDKQGIEIDADSVEDWVSICLWAVEPGKHDAQAPRNVLGLEIFEPVARAERGGKCSAGSETGSATRGARSSQEFVRKERGVSGPIPDEPGRKLAGSAGSQVFPSAGLKEQNFAADRASEGYLGDVEPAETPVEQVEFEP